MEGDILHSLANVGLSREYYLQFFYYNNINSTGIAITTFINIIMITAIIITFLTMITQVIKLTDSILSNKG